MLHITLQPHLSFCQSHWLYRLCNIGQTLNQWTEYTNKSEWHLPTSTSSWGRNMTQMWTDVSLMAKHGCRWGVVHFDKFKEVVKKKKKTECPAQPEQTGVVTVCADVKTEDGWIWLLPEKLLLTCRLCSEKSDLIPCEKQLSQFSTRVAFTGQGSYA